MADESLASSLRARLLTDAVRGVRLAVCAVALFALVEPVVAILFAQGHVRVPVALRFFALDLTLAGLLLVLVAALLAGGFAAARGALHLVDVEREASWPGALGPAPARPHDHVGVTPWFWAVAIALAGYGAGSFALTLLFIKRFKEPTLIAGSLAAIQVVLILVVAVVVTLLSIAFRRAARALAPHLGPWNPLGRALPALGLLTIIVLPVAALIVHFAPQVRAVAPWRELFALLVLAVGAILGVRRFAAQPLVEGADRRRRRRIYGGVAVGYVLLAALTLTKLGADPETKYLAISASPPLARLVDLVRVANDFDRDGYGSLLGENDCAPFNKKIHPTARDIPDNGIDENCNGRDFSVKNAPAYKSGEKMPVPAQFKRDYNVLLITIDTVRYDHTTMGGYVKKKGRDTTPRLAELARRAVNFEFANAPSAGTMASVPAIIMSRFFHSGIHLGPERRPMPPKILPDNTTMGEMMKTVGYHTGAITTHEYFNDWGLDQGFDTYDNELGAKPDPYGIKADKTTDKAQAWIAKQGANKWFLWVHYIDPHGRYVAHPGETQYGATEEDIYDGELHWTDKNIGKLLDYLAHTPNADKTIIVITSDHGDGFNEHGFINHGQKLYRELQNVPLIVYVPENEPVSVLGPVSNLDIFPTLADIAGADIRSLPVEGESLVPQLFYGRDAKDRVVFCETNYPDPLRAVISDRYKLIYNLKANVYELYDLHADPWEHKNLWGSDIEGGKKMKELMDEWLDRVFYSREAGIQTQEVRKEALLPARPSPLQATDVTGAGTVRVIGYDLAKPGYKPGDTLDLTLYFETVGETTSNFRLEAGVSSLATGAQPPAVRQDKVPLDGLFPTSRWKKGEFVKETYAIKLPGGWPTGPAKLTFRLLDDRHQPVTLVGAGGAPVGLEATLGDLQLETQPSPEPVPTPVAPVLAPGMQPHK
jgi:arylsulfatase A-like enzyme